jgi:hypothetical protein
MEHRETKFRTTQRSDPCAQHKPTLDVRGRRRMNLGKWFSDRRGERRVCTAEDAIARAAPPPERAIGRRFFNPAK